MYFELWIEIEDYIQLDLSYWWYNQQNTKIYINTQANVWKRVHL